MTKPKKVYWIVDTSMEKDPTHCRLGLESAVNFGKRLSKEPFECPLIVMSKPFTGVIWAFRPEVRKVSTEGPGGPKSQKTIGTLTVFQFFIRFSTLFPTLF